MKFNDNNHQYCNELNDLLVDLERFAINYTCSAATTVTREIDNDVEVIFDDVNTPVSPSNLGRLNRLLDELWNKYDHYPLTSDEQVIVHIIKALRCFSDEASTNVSLEDLNDLFSNDIKDERVLADIKRIKGIVVNTHPSFIIAGCYCHSARTITLYTRHLSNYEDYISIFAHEYFHAIHHYLLDKRGAKKSRTKYYHQVVFESLATAFQIAFLKEIGLRRKADEVFDQIQRHSPIFYPYSGAKKLVYGSADFCYALDLSINSFKNCLFYIVDRFEAEIILKMKPIPAIVSSPIYVPPIQPILSGGNVDCFADIEGKHPRTSYYRNGVPIILIPDDPNSFENLYLTRGRYQLAIIYTDFSRYVITVNRNHARSFNTDIISHIKGNKMINNNPSLLDGAICIIAYIC